jgi:hypothetical protein
VDPDTKQEVALYLNRVQSVAIHRLEVEKLRSFDR